MSNRRTILQHVGGAGTPRAVLVKVASRFFVTQRPIFHVPHFGTFHMAARGLAELAHGSYTL